MDIEEEIIKHLAPELYKKISNLEQAINFIKVDIDNIRSAVSSLQDTIMDLSNLFSELKGRYESIEDTVIAKIKNEFQQALITRLKDLLDKKL